jgi:thioredoxin-related protein
MIKRLFFATVFSLLACFSYSQESPPSAAIVLHDAINVAAKEKKNVLVMFTASWCVWCKKMDKSINDSTCKNFFDDNFIIRHLVVDEMKGKEYLENPGADSLRNLYNGKGFGIPYWLIFDTKGKLLSDSRIEKDETGSLSIIGCPATEKEVRLFISILEKTSKLKKEQLDIIYTRFRQNEISK